MRYLVALHDVAEVLGLAFVGELRRVHADDHELVGVLLLEALQIREDVDAVDAPIGPEVQEDDLPLQVVQGQRRGRVDPVEAGGEVRSIDRPCKGLSLVGRGGRRV